ncbi:MAG: DUF4838 domain-containing protein, partial [Ruminococcaceae bacterium]|nr:DUF4838 domain-containing protein [Oscillospiraceae bacterium]
RENIRFFAENNAIGIFQEGHSGSESFEFGDLRAYLLAKLYWNPYMSEEEFNYHMNDFLQYNYGAGWEYLRQYIELAQDLSKDKHFGIGFPVEVLADFVKVNVNESSAHPEDITVDMIKNYETVDWTKYWNFYIDISEPVILTEGERLFALAYEAAETEEEKARIEKISLQLDYLRSYYLGLKLEAGEVKLGAGEVSIGKIVGNFVQNHPEEFTADEQKSYRRAIIIFAREQSRASYAEYNKNMLLEMIKYGAPVVLHINKYIDEARLDSLKLEYLPHDWYD